MPKSQKKPPVLLKKIRKRDGTVVAFDQSRIAAAVFKAMRATGEGSEKDAGRVAESVVRDLLKAAKHAKGKFIPNVEGVQDLVEAQLILHEFVKASKAYILYRQRRAELRQQKGEVPKEVRELADESKKYFRSQLAEFVYYTTYSKWIPEKHRRETWLETVDRYGDFMRENLGEKLNEKEYAEILYVLMCGSGVGFSVEHQTVELLPLIKKQLGEKPETFQIKDSKEGWGDALTYGMKLWSEGRDVVFDYALIRPQGAGLARMGGRASGPRPLRSLLDFTREKMFNRQGRRLSTLDVHDIVCKIGEVVVMGGVRRRALIFLSDLD